MWSYANHSISKVAVEQPEQVSLKRVSSVAVSLCGNFGVLGYENGLIQKFNIQSGTDRGFFTVMSASDGENQQQHTAEVTSLAIDQLNYYLTSCSLD